MHLLAAISPHGFGHLAQTSAVLNDLRRRLPALRLTVRTALPRHILERRIAGPFEVQYAEDDFGMVQHDALGVDVEASARRYAQRHGDWERRAAEVAGELTAAAADLVLADVPYLTLAGAARAGITGVGMCCLNWADIYRHYCGERPEAPAILAQMEGAYNGASHFLRTAPAMPMSFLENARDIGPVVAPGSNRRAEIDRRLGSRGDRLVLVAVGGIHLRLPVERWPRLPGVRWLVPREWRAEHPDALCWEALELPFADVLASCDLLITKPGYGSFTEAAASGLPVLYLPRPGWPESPYLERWLAANGRCRAIPREAVNEGRLSEYLTPLLEAGRGTPIDTPGAREAAAFLAALLR